jgi:hypothetical protein
MLSCSSESVYKSKAKRKSKRVSADGLIEFLLANKVERLNLKGMRQCVNNVIKLLCYLSGSFAFRI